MRRVCVGTRQQRDIPILRSTFMLLASRRQRQSLLLCCASRRMHRTRPTCFQQLCVATLASDRPTRDARARRALFAQLRPATRFKRRRDLVFFFFSLSSRVPPAPGPVPSRSAQEFSRTTILLPLLRSRLLFTIWREARPSTRFANAARHYAGQHTLARAGRGRKGETTAAVRRCDAINPRRS